jgi:formate hydrogenlyase transcriptional activator
MSAQTSLVSEALNRTASFEIPAGLPANTGFDGDELCDRSSPRIVGTSAALESVLEQVKQVASTDSTVLIEGETGTGKELIAHAIHNASQRVGRAFIKLNCAAIPLDLLESELFGHEKGAFTGAIAQKIGRFEMADKGTLFLDEVGDIPSVLQPKLLRVLQEQEFERLGSGRTHKVDVRLVAATNRNLLRMVARGQFRSDLYYRLNVFPVLLPALRARREDIPALVRHFVKMFSRRMGKQVDSIPPETMAAFQSYSWPGNIRELQNLVERAVIFSHDGVLQNPLHKKQTEVMIPGLHRTRTYYSSKAFEDSDRALILETLEQAGWIVGGPHGAATKLGVKRTTLLVKLRRLGISRPIPQKGTGVFGVARADALPNPLPTAMAPITLSSATDKPPRDPDSVAMTLRDSERALILQALEATDWRIGGPKGAALKLGLNRTTLIYKMKKFGIHRSCRCSGFTLVRHKLQSVGSPDNLTTAGLRSPAGL